MKPSTAQQMSTLLRLIVVASTHRWPADGYFPLLPSGKRSAVLTLNAYLCWEQGPAHGAPWTPGKPGVSVATWEAVSVSRRSERQEVSAVGMRRGASWGDWATSN